MSEQLPNWIGWSPRVAKGSWRGAWAGWAAALVLASALGCTANINDGMVQRVGVADLSKRAESERVLLIDARSAEAHREGRIPGSVRMTLADVSAERRDPALERYKTLVVYGQNPGTGSAIALAKRLMALKYGDVQYFEGGVDAWVAANRPLERAGP